MPTWQLHSRVPGVNNPSVVSAASAFEDGASLGDPGYAFCASDNPAGPVEAGCREVPDISAAADEFTGGITVFIEQFGGWNTFGGTSSAASPVSGDARGGRTPRPPPRATRRRATGSASSARSSVASRIRPPTRRRSTTSRWGSNNAAEFNLFHASGSTWPRVSARRS